MAVEILSRYTHDITEDASTTLADIMWMMGSEVARESVRIAERLGHDAVSGKDVRLAASGIKVSYVDGETRVSVRIPVEGVHRRHDDRDDAIREEWETGGLIRRRP